MDKDYQDEEFQEIVTNVHDYALVRVFQNNGIYYRLFHQPKTAYALIERDREKLIDALLARGILIANSEEEFRPKDFNRCNGIGMKKRRKVGWFLKKKYVRY